MAPQQQRHARPSLVVAASGRCCYCRRVTRKLQQLLPQGHAADLRELLLLPPGQVVAATAGSCNSSSNCGRQTLQLLPPGAVAAATRSCDSSSNRSFPPTCSLSMRLLCLFPAFPWRSSACTHSLRPSCTTGASPASQSSNPRMRRACPSMPSTAAGTTSMHRSTCSP